MKIIEKYHLANCMAKVLVEIVQEENALATEYRVGFPKVGEGTRLTLDEIKINILSRSKVPVEKMVDLKFAEQVKKDFSDLAEELFLKKLPSSDKNEIEVLREIMLNEMLGLGNIEYILHDDNIEEIVVNSAIEPAWVYHKKYGWLKSNLMFKSEKEIENFSSIIARKSGKQITLLNPLLDAHLPSGDRANATLSPVSTQGNTITIRRFRRKPWTVTDLILEESVSSEAMAIIWTAFQYELNILFTGGTASGKTSFLNACLAFIPPNQRVITIEDTRELTLPKFLHWVPMNSRSANTEGKGEISMLDLLVNSLRMRPDRIIVGEVRRQREAEVMFEAMNTGHSVYATFHADTAEETIRRFSNPPIALPQAILSSISLNVTLFRNRRNSKRSVYQLSEIIIEDRGNEQQAKTNIMYRFNSMKNELRKQKESIKLFDQIAIHTGMSGNEIELDLKEKQKILQWLVEKKVFDMDELGMVFAKYYLDSQKVISFAEKGKDPKELFLEK